jgi:hypothetical protein
MAYGSDLGASHTDVHRLSRRFLEPAQGFLVLGLALARIVSFKRALSRGIGGISPAECWSVKDLHELSSLGTLPGGPHRWGTDTASATASLVVSGRTRRLVERG